MVIINDTDHMRSIAKEYQWLRAHYPGYRLIQQALIMHNNRAYDRMTFQTAYGKQKTVFFDITATFRHSEGTQALYGETGTMARLTPGTATRPQLIQMR